MNLPPTLRKLAGGGVTFSRALLKDGNLLSRPQPEAVLAPVSYRSSRRRRQRKRLLLKVPSIIGSRLGYEIYAAEISRGAVRLVCKAWFAMAYHCSHKKVLGVRKF